MRKRRVAIDCCIAARIAPALENVFGLNGYDFIHVSQLGGGKDEDWAEVFKRFGGEIVLSGDVSIAKKPHQQAAFIDCGLICYFPRHPFQNLRIHQQAAYLMHNWELIHEHLKKVNSPSCWGMPTSHRDMSLTLNMAEFKRMEVPKKVLDEVRKMQSK